MELIPAGLGLVGSLFESDAASDAADTQAGASAAAIAEQRRQFDLTRGDYAPYLEAGKRALGTYEQQLGRVPSAAEVMAEPGYQFGLSEGQRAIDRSFSRSGGRISGAAMKAGTRFAQNYAGGQYNAAYQRGQDRLNRLAAIANLGQTATGSSAAAGARSTNAISELISSQGDAAAAGQLARGNIWGNAANQLGALYQRGTTGTSGTNRNVFRRDDPYRDPNYFGGDEGE